MNVDSHSTITSYITEYELTFRSYREYPLATFEENLERILVSQIDGCRGLKHAERLSGGAAQETYRIECVTESGVRLLAMRRAAGGVTRPPNDTQPGLAAEARMMQCAKEAGVPTPEIYYVLSRDDDLGDGFIMEWLEGEGLGTRILRDQQLANIRPQLAYECGRIAARIHGIDVVEKELDKLLVTMTPADYVQQTWSRYKEVGTPHPMIDYVGSWLMQHLPETYRTVLVHNEFRNGNLMVSSEGIVGVVDWEVAHLGDPMRDLGWLCTSAWRYGESLPVGGFGTYDQLFQGYEDESGISVDPGHVFFWEVFGSFWWSVTCLGMVEQFRYGPDPSIERAAIGRRAYEGQVDCVNLLIPGSVALLEPTLDKQNVDSPRSQELLSAVSTFLRNDVMQETGGRTRFLARVSANVIDIILRETRDLQLYRQMELDSLCKLFSVDGESLEALRWRLVESLRKKGCRLDDESMQAHLRQTVVNQIAIDNPKYSGLEQALNWK